MQPSARVASGVDITTPLQTFLTERSLTVIYNIPEPLSATPPSDPTLVTMIADLRAELKEHAKRLTNLEAEVELLSDSTLQGLPVVLRAILDAHLFQLGYDPRRAQPSRSQFITLHLVDLAAALGVSRDHIQRIFEHHKDGDTSAHMTNSLSVANAITCMHMSSQDKSLWRSIFQKTFNKSIADQLADRRGVIWSVDARQGQPVGSRFTLVDRQGRGPIRSFEFN